MRRIRLILVVAVLARWAYAKPQAAASAPDLVDEVWQIVNDNLYDAKFNGVDWSAARARCRERLRSNADAAREINVMLDELRISHTHLYRAPDPRYYELLDIYRNALGDDLERVFPDGIVKYPEAETRSSTDGSHRIIVPHEMFLDAMRKSARVIERDSKRLAYIHIRSFAGEQYQQLLIDLLNAEPLRSCDGLVLDIRGGWGGANPEYISVFGCTPPRVEMSNREGQVNRIETDAGQLVPANKQWRKPVVLLVDDGTRSGKEVFTYAFRKCHRGTIVGTRTAGAVVGGRPFLLSDGSLLVVAVSDVRLDDGVRLEGVGVEPDVRIERGEARASNDPDPQTEGAVGALLAAINAAEPSHSP
jgi:C-terminal processing protease CtpA/Prc